MKKTVFRYGSYGAIVISVLFILGWFIGESFDFSTQEIIGYVSMIVSLSFVYFGIKHFRDKENNGKVTLGKALLIGVLISLITALAFGMIDVIYIKYLNPDFMTEYYEHAIEQMRTTLSAEAFKIKLAELEAEKELFSSLTVSFLLMSFTVFIIGFIISLLSAFILQRK
ncbi:MAG: DUF4199 domain-containing protein [Flavobacteriaceae bacterium]|nr:MAG: DUF4199 domain-containing protein [Flavobacteriaceae bacterium]